MIKIKSIQNGYILKYTGKEYDENGQEGKFKETLIFQNNEDSENGVTDAKNVRELLYEVIDKLGIIFTKYDKERIDINIVHGEKYECREKECLICKTAKY